MYVFSMCVCVSNIIVMNYAYCQLRAMICNNTEKHFKSNENLLPNKQSIEYIKRREFFGIFESKNYCSLKNLFVIFIYSLFFSKVTIFLILF